MMTKDIRKDLSLRKLQTTDLIQFNELLRYAFQVTDEDLLKVGWEEEEIRRAKFPILEETDVLGWFEGEKLASQIAVYPFQVNITGRLFDMGYITGVATYPEYMGMGLMSVLMKKSLQGMREKGQSVSFLYPYSIPLYRYKGWEIVSDKMTYRLMAHQLPKNVKVPGRVRRVPTDSPDLIDLHDRFAKGRHGCLIRTSLAWEEYWRWEVESVKVAIYYNQKQEATGYLIYLIENDIFKVKEIVYLNQEARKGLWGYIGAHQSMVDEVIGNNYNNHTIAFLFGDSAMKETIRPYIMARIVDFEAFIEKYQFEEVDTDQAITFVIEDSVLEWNNQSFTLQFRKGQKPMLIKQSSPHQVRLEIGILTAMLLGYESPSYFKSIERLEADKKTLAILEQVIPNEKIYFSDYI